MENNKQTTELNSEDRNGISRRNFMTKTILLGAVLAVGSLSLAATSDQPKEINNRSDKGLRKGENNMETRKLGKLEVSELGGPQIMQLSNF
jgi:hypothetical protein